MSTAWTRPEFRELAAAVTGNTGLAFPPNRRAGVESAIAVAMRRSGHSDLAEYVAAVTGSEALLDELSAELTIGETYFFREPAQFELIRHDLGPELGSDRARPIRAWSAGCASGEEAYSLALIFRELALANASIVGTDISRDRLAKARAGRYRQWSFRGVRQEVVQKYFRRSAGELTLIPEIRRSVEFGYLNLAADIYPSLTSGVWGMDLILCRNVLIYFDRETIERVAARLIDSLSDRGFLLLGASDPLLSEFVDCAVDRSRYGVVYRRPARQLRAAGRPDAARAAEPPRPVDAAASAEPAPTALAARERHDEADRDPVHETHDYEAVAARAQRQISSGNDAAEVWITLVQSLANLGRLPEAGAACARALERHHTVAHLHYLDSVLLTQAGRPSDAAAAARRALYLDRSMVVAHLALGVALARAGARAAALRAVENAERLLELLPADAVVPASDGETADRLLQFARVQRRLLEKTAA